MDGASFERKRKKKFSSLWFVQQSLIERVKKHWRASHAIRKCNGSLSVFPFDPFVIITGRTRKKRKKKKKGEKFILQSFRGENWQSYCHCTWSVSISHLIFLSYVLAVSKGVEQSLFSSSSLINSPIHLAPQCNEQEEEGEEALRLFCSRDPRKRLKICAD